MGDLNLHAELLKLMREDEKAHRDVSMNQRCLEAAGKVEDHELKSLLTELASEEEEHQKKRIRLLEKAINKVKNPNFT